MVRPSLLLALLSHVPLLVACARTPQPEQPEDAPPEDLDRALVFELAAAAPGAQRQDLFGGMSLGGDEKQPFGAELKKDACYWFIGVAESPVKELALYLFDPAGGRVATEKGSARPVLRACANETGRYKLEVVPSGKGAFQVGLYVKP